MDSALGERLEWLQGCSVWTALSNKRLLIFNKVIAIIDYKITKMV